MGQFEKNNIFERDLTNDLYFPLEKVYQRGENMTLVSAMKTKEAIILGSDSRGLVGGFGAYNDNQEKLIRINNFAIGIAGIGEIGLSLLQIHRNALANDQLSIDLLAHTISLNFSQSYMQWFDKTLIDQRPFISFILAGYRDSKSAGYEPTIYSFRSNLQFTPELAGKNPVFIGYSQIAEYLSSKFYSSQISKEKAKILSVYIITETSSWNINVGGNVHVIEIAPTIPPKELETSEVAKIIRENMVFNENIYQEFNNLKISSTPQT